MVTVREAPWTRSPTHSVTWAGRDSTKVGAPHFPRRSRRESPTETTPPGQLIPSAARAGTARQRGDDRGRADEGEQERRTASTDGGILAPPERNVRPPCSTGLHGDDAMKDLKEREMEARARLAERLKRLRSEMIRRPAAGPGAPAPGGRSPPPGRARAAQLVVAEVGAPSAPRRGEPGPPGPASNCGSLRPCPRPLPSRPVLIALTLPLGVRPGRDRAAGTPDRRTAGRILVGGGSGVPAAMRQAVSAIEQHCRGVYEVVEIAQVQTGQTTSTGVGYSFGPVAVGTSSASPVFGTSITYLCREPASTVLNESVIQMASADMVGRKCRSDDECGPLFCTRVEPAAEFGACAAQGGGPGGPVATSGGPLAAPLPVAQYSAPM